MLMRRRAGCMAWGQRAMVSRYTWYLREILKKVWVRVVGFAFLALLSVGLAHVLSPYLAEDLAIRAGADAVEQLLGVLTSSMLAVTTFSLSIAVSAFAAAASTATPRAAVLLQEDRTTQNVLATFLGAFLFGLVGLVALNADLYDAAGRVVIFLFTIVVIGFVVLALFRWIGHLMQFGRMGDTLDRVEAATAAALELRLADPYMGGRILSGEPDHGMHGVDARTTGYVQHVDMQALHDCATAYGVQVYLRCLPGSFVTMGAPLARLSGAAPDPALCDTICRAITIGKRRTFEGDPRFGLIVLAEIASRALSPAVNDPGTAIDVLGRFVRILSLWRDRAAPEIRFPDIFVPPILPRDAIADAFRPLARDGAGLVEVQVRLQKALTDLRRIAPDTFGQATTRMAQDALARAEAAAPAASDLADIRAAARLVPTPAGAPE
ncbi:DUF2254 domain-containing protein [Seohaeicola saemankumensis]|uniref:DUF2254 domain-containing protein n=1 Tax=Seohaeicola saemankumensis TaxID=481181 RepID=A0ABW3TKE1_9RHOB